MRTEVTELPESRVRIDVAVDSADVEHSIEHAAGHLAEDMRIPGFRKGKVPPAIVVQRVGREAVLDAALREFLPGWYERALLNAGITPVGDPKLNVEALPERGEALEFSIEVTVRPQAKLGEYRGLEVGRASSDPEDEDVEAELDRLRQGFASLSPVDRPAAEGDLVLIDYSGEVEGGPFEGSEASDFLVELDSEGLLPEFREALAGAVAGDVRKITARFPEGHRPEAIAGKEATFEVIVKEVREKRLPELDDDFASEASEFETLAELRDEIRRSLAEAMEARVDADFRQAAVDDAAQQAEIELSQEIVKARAEEMLDRFLHNLSHRGIDPESFLRVQAGGREGMLEQLRDDAERGLRREATLVAIADAEGIEASEEEMVEALAPAEGETHDAARTLEALRESGRDSLLREDVRLRKAAEIVAQAATAIPLERAAAREKLWTPEKERREEGEGAGLWTPGSEPGASIDSPTR